jgi:hypothetical protein
MIDGLDDSQPSITGNAFRFLGKHLLGVALIYQPLDNERKPVGLPEARVYAGSILSNKDKWYWITAGHILVALDNIFEQQRLKRLKVERIDLLDYFSSEHLYPIPIPLDYERRPKFFIDSENDGLDFGLMELSELLKLNLQRNKIEPFTQTPYAVDDDNEFDAHIILGFPTDLLESYPGTTNVGIAPAVIAVTRIDDTLDLRSTTFSRFVGQLEQIPISMNGMSGGPIFGLRNDKYRVIAIQSSWNEPRLLTFGCPVRTILLKADEFLTRE